MLGRPKRVDPVFTKHLAGPWLKFSVDTPERNARSSTTPPMLGSSSETYFPDFPYCLNSRRVPSSLGGSLENVSMNAKRLPLSRDSGVLLPSYCCRTGLESNSSSWLGAPAM